jgi:DNA-binding CsgD family transcriptional regulator/tetratricopeptide (TPR) repeat protein
MDEATGAIYAGCRAIFQNAAEEGLLVIAIEDLQWANPSSLELFGFLAATFRHEPIVLAGTVAGTEEAAPGQGSHLSTLLRALRRLPEYRMVEVHPLAREDAAALVAGCIPEPDQALVDRVVERSEGNPLFIQELAAFAEEGGSGMPQSLSGLLLARLDDLPDGARRAVEFMVVAGRPLQHQLLATVTGLGPSRLKEALAELLRRGLIERTADAFALRHTLFRDALLQQSSPWERESWHSTLADALTAASSRGGLPALAGAEIAFHLRSAGRLSEALSATIASARAASSTCAYAEAELRFGDALEIWEQLGFAPQPEIPSKTALLQEAAEAAFSAGDAEVASNLIRTGLREVSSNAHPWEEAGLRRRLGTYLLGIVRDRDAIAELTRALELLADAGRSLERARTAVTLGAALMLVGEYDQSLRWCREALADAAALSDLYTQSQALNFIGVDLISIGEVDEGLASLSRAGAVARNLGRDDAALEAALNLSEMLTQLDRLPEAVDIASKAAGDADAKGLTARIGANLWSNAGAAMWRMGRWAEAESVLQQAIAHARSGEAIYNLAINLAWLKLGRGEYQSAKEYLSQAANEAHSERVDVLPHLTRAKAEVAIADGQLEVARSVVGSALEAMESTIAPHLSLPLLGTAVHIEAEDAGLRRRLRETSAVSAAVEAADDFAGRAEAMIRGRRATSESMRAELWEIRGELAKAKDHPMSEPWKEAAACWLRANQPYRVALALHRQAEALLAEHGPRAEARDLLRVAAIEAASLGALPLSGAISATARHARLRIDVPQDTSSRNLIPDPLKSAGLTPRELDILRLVTEGLTNRRIAGLLFISEATVATHVAHIMSKLDVHTRYDAAALAKELQRS